MSDVRLLLICCVPELGEQAMARAAEVVEGAVRAHAPRGPTTRVLRRDGARCRALLSALARQLRAPAQRAVVYYYGHGTQVRDRGGDEDDGLDEVWSTQGITDDELSALFAQTHPTSRLYVLSDSCASGTMIDARLNRAPWVTLSSAADAEEALATADGGAFTVWGLVPALRALAAPTPRAVHAYATRAIELGTQTCTLRASDPRLLDEPIFAARAPPKSNQISKGNQ
jgi:hypothetical protein